MHKATGKWKKKGCVEGRRDRAMTSGIDIDGFFEGLSFVKRKQQ